MRRLAIAPIPSACLSRRPISIFCRASFMWTAPVEQGVFLQRFAGQVRFIHVYGLLHAARGRWP
jgi:hypothetical protein